VADPQSQFLLIDEMIANPQSMERMLRDPYANYVVQTAVRVSYLSVLGSPLTHTARLWTR
jgi:hypothetical protein